MAGALRLARRTRRVAAATVRRSCQLYVAREAPCFQLSSPASTSRAPRRSWSRPWSASLPFVGCALAHGLNVTLCSLSLSLSLSLLLSPFCRSSAPLPPPPLPPLPFRPPGLPALPSMAEEFLPYGPYDEAVAGLCGLRRRVRLQLLPGEPGWRLWALAVSGPSPLRCGDSSESLHLSIAFEAEICGLCVSPCLYSVWFSTCARALHRPPQAQPFLRGGPTTTTPIARRALRAQKELAQKETDHRVVPWPALARPHVARRVARLVDRRSSPRT